MNKSWSWWEPATTTETHFRRTRLGKCTEEGWPRDVCHLSCESSRLLPGTGQKGAPGNRAWPMEGLRVVGVAGTQVEEARVRQEFSASPPALGRSALTLCQSPTPTLRAYQPRAGPASLLIAVLSPSSSLASGISGCMKGTRKLKAQRSPQGPHQLFLGGSEVSSRQVDQGVPMSRSPQHALSLPALSEQMKEGEMKGTSGTIDTK